MRVMLDEGAYLPERAHLTDAGLDIRARDGQIVPAKESAVFFTGVHVEIPRGCAGLLVSKSGLNVRHGIVSDGLIDEGYTGEIVVKLHNLGGRDYRVEPGDKISQMIIVPVRYEDVEQVGELDGGTARGDAGFGSTGR